jgi:hypothetical protein
MYFSFYFYTLHLILLECQQKEAPVIMPHDTLELSFYRMAEYKKTLHALFQQAKGISERRGKFYLDWQRVLWNSINA